MQHLAASRTCRREITPEPEPEPEPEPVEEEPEPEFIFKDFEPEPEPTPPPPPPPPCLLAGSRGQRLPWRAGERAGDGRGMARAVHGWISRSVQTDTVLRRW